jgi:DNA-binding XRE family transcriptional regulator
MEIKKYFNNEILNMQLFAYLSIFNVYLNAKFINYAKKCTFVIMTKEEIGGLIKKTRKNLNITQKDLAEISESSLRNLIDIEAGKANLTIDQLQKILSTLGLRVIVEVVKYE